MTQKTPPPNKPTPPQGYYVLRGVAVPWRRYPPFMTQGYRIEGDEAVSLCGTKRTKLPDIERNGNIDASIITFMFGLAFGSILFCILFT